MVRYTIEQCIFSCTVVVRKINPINEKNIRFRRHYSGISFPPSSTVFILLKIALKSIVFIAGSCRQCVVVLQNFKKLKGKLSHYTP
jgi:hypothetical protein